MKKMIRRGLLVGALGVALVASFGWGYFAHRNKIFPYPQFVSLLVEVSRTMVTSDSVAPNPTSLVSLPYVSATFDPESHRAGVLRYNEEKAHCGLNFYNSRTSRSAILITMSGETVREWSYPTSEDWQHVDLASDGGVLALVYDEELVSLDLRSQLRWRYEARVHHDLWRHDDKIFVLAREARPRPDIHPKHPTLEDFVVILSAEGRELERISVLDAVLESPYAYLVPFVADLEIPPDPPGTEPELDILHTNHVEVFDGRLQELSPLFAEGNILLSARSLHAIFILDGETREVLWLWGPGNLTLQHHPILLENGHILVFDNGLEQSEVVEVDPLTSRIVWRYRAPEFFSERRGSVQRLANGNTLITESDTGYVFEVTPSGKTVWEFANPDVTEDGLRSAIWRMRRFEPEALNFIPDDADPC